MFRPLFILHYASNTSQFICHKESKIRSTDGQTEPMLATAQCNDAVRKEKSSTVGCSSSSCVY